MQPISLRYLKTEYDAIQYEILFEQTIIGKIDILLNSPFFKEHDHDKNLINEVSIKIDKEFRNNGYGYKALKLLIEEYKKLNLDKELWSIVHIENIPSKKLHDKLLYLYKKEYLKYIVCTTEQYVCYRLV